MGRAQNAGVSVGGGQAASTSAVGTSAVGTSAVDALAVSTSAVGTPAACDATANSDLSRSPQASAPEGNTRNAPAQEAAFPAAASPEEETAQQLQEQQRMVREIAMRALAGVRQQVAYLQRRIERNARDAALCERLQQCLDADAAARRPEGWGRCLLEAGRFGGADRYGAALYGGTGGEPMPTSGRGDPSGAGFAGTTYGDAALFSPAPVPLEDDERKRIGELLRQHAPMSDSDAARYTTILSDLAIKLTGELGGGAEQESGLGPAVVEIGRVEESGEEREVVLNA